MNSNALLGTAHSQAARRWFLSAALAILLCTGLSSQAAATLELYIDAPILGQFTESTTATVMGSGHRPAGVDCHTGSQRTNDHQPRRRWLLEHRRFPGPESKLFHAIQADLIATDNAQHRELVTIILGASINDGERAESGAALRLNDEGLGVLAGTMTDDLNIDIDTLLPPGTLLIQDLCYATFIWCLGTVSAVVASSPPPSIGDFGTELDSRTDIAHADIALHDLFVNVEIFDTSGLLGISCTLTITAR